MLVRSQGLRLKLQQWLTGKYNKKKKTLNQLNLRNRDNSAVGWNLEMGFFA